MYWLLLYFWSFKMGRKGPNSRNVLAALILRDRRQFSTLFFLRRTFLLGGVGGKSRKSTFLSFLLLYLSMYFAVKSTFFLSYFRGGGGVKKIKKVLLKKINVENWRRSLTFYILGSIHNNI